MRVLVSGSTGLIGTALVAALGKQGFQVERLVRRPGPWPEPALCWDPAAGTLDPAAIEGFDAVIHLAGESVGARRWTHAVKAAIRDSRVQSTRLLSQTMARLERPPRVWLCASAVGYYGDREDHVLEETSESGRGFLAEVCVEWEAATRPAADAGVRVANLRFGVVQSPNGGALAAMLGPFRLGLGGAFGHGGQYISWISIDDAVRAVLHVLGTPALAGPVNIVGPNPVTNREFVQALAAAVHRPAVLPVPAFMARLVFGEAADALMLTGQRVVPRRLNETGFAFHFPDLTEALLNLLGARR